MNTNLFLNVIKNINDKEAQSTINQSINNFCFIVLHLVDARYYIAKTLNIDIKNPLTEYENITHPEDIKNYPKLDVLKNYWINLDLVLSEKLNSLDNDSLNIETETTFPYVGNKTKDIISFLLQHESLHIGQLSILRKLLGKDSLSYK